MKVRFRFIVFVCATLFLCAAVTFCQSDSNLGAVGVGVKVSTLGVGAEVATPVLRRVNLRAGFNVLGYSRGFSNDGISYDGHLNFKTVEGHIDFFPFGGKFHVSLGFLAYLDDPIKATAFVPGGQSFTLGGVTYYSDTAVPTSGSGKIDFNQGAPTLTVGWGNLVPRKHGKHFSFPVELGVAFQGSPQSTLNLTGNVCALPGVGCRSVASDPTVQSNVVAQQNKINNSISFLQAYPIISAGFGYKF
ncbi:MAG: hypothetical protein WA824_03815 [Candidatus Sulfotelmatobacter sp.]